MFSPPSARAHIRFPLCGAAVVVAASDLCLLTVVYILFLTLASVASLGDVTSGSAAPREIIYPCRGIGLCGAIFSHVTAAPCVFVPRGIVGPLGGTIS